MLIIKYSKHARLRMVERRISRQEVAEAINKGEKRLQGDKIVSAYAYFEVVYRKLGSEIYIIAVKPRW